MKSERPESGTFNFKPKHDNVEKNSLNDSGQVSDVDDDIDVITLDELNDSSSPFSSSSHKTPTNDANQSLDTSQYMICYRTFTYFL